MSQARRRALLVLFTCLGLAVAGMVAGPANAASPAPVRIQIDRVWSDTTAPSGTPDTSVPYVLVKAGDDFHIDVSFYDADNQPASFSGDTTLNISSSAGALTPSTGIAPKGEDHATLTTSLGAAANQVSLTVSVATKGRKVSDVAPGTSATDQLFDVLSELDFADTSAGQNFAQGIGGDGNCTEATRTAPVCGILLLPNGANSHPTTENPDPHEVLLSLGKCDSSSTYAACGGNNKGVVVQALADLSDLYTKSSPAAIVIKCDKSLCKGGAINNYHLSFTLAGNGALDTAPACPAKGTIGADQDACVDYVQSTRDGAGDTLLYLLADRDLRVGMG